MKGRGAPSSQSTASHVNAGTRRTDANDKTAAALEGVTYADGLKNINVGGDDSLFSSVERIFVVTNGFTNAAINSAKLQNGNINYSASWEANLVRVEGSITLCGGSY